MRDFCFWKRVVIGMFWSVAFPEYALIYLYELDQDRHHRTWWLIFVCFFMSISVGVLLYVTHAISFVELRSWYVPLYGGTVDDVVSRGLSIQYLSVFFCGVFTGVLPPWSIMIRYTGFALVALQEHTVHYWPLVVVFFISHYVRMWVTQILVIKYRLYSLRAVKKWVLMSFKLLRRA